MGSRKSSSISNTVKFTVGNGRFGRPGATKALGPRQLVQKQKEAKERYHRSVEGLSNETLQTLDELSGQPSGATGDDRVNNLDVGIDQGDVVMGDTANEELGESGHEVESIVYDLRDMVGLTRWHGVRRYKDSRTWKRRLRLFNEKWVDLMDALTETYIGWKYGSGLKDAGTDNATSVDNTFEIDIVDIYGLERVATIPRKPEDDVVIALARAGYLAVSPQFPSLALSFKTLELFRVTRLFKASFSVEAFTKVICYQYMIPYRRSYRTALSDAFDIYLAIRRRVDALIARELNHDTPNYRVLHSCPACTYELEGEPSLKYSRMWVVDGNNSLKRMKGIQGRQIADTRIFTESDYFLSEDFVNKYAGEVKPRSEPTAPVHNDEDDEDDEDAIAGVGLEGGDPTDGFSEEDKSFRGCRTNFKAAASDSAKRMWNAFHESGIFASACRHGFILWLVDMIRSGELAKYPLALVAKALEVLGPRWLMGYDIGCSFGVTVSNSSLGAEFTMKECRTCVNAFHGYTHDANCQRQHHPLNILGMGLEDLETMERIFSASNQLASVTRFMSSYRRRLAIDAFFQQWDDDKYLNLGTMLYNNYIQALDIISEEGPMLQHDLEYLKLSEDKLEEYFADEANHMEELGTEAQDDLHAIAYVELLQKYRDINTAYENVNSSFRLQIPSDYQFLVSEKSYGIDLSETRRTETRRRFISQKRDQLLFELTQMEARMGIDQRWAPTSKDYREAVLYMNTRKYRQALEKLHKLVVQRLFELHKMNLSQTGYRMRTHIAHALQRRSKAIRKAVRDYNEAAKSLDPPRPMLDWSKVSHFSFLDQFDILRDTRHSVFDKPWTDPVKRNLMKTYRRVMRAREEITRLNVEIRRLHTSIVDEQCQFDAVVLRLESGVMLGPVSDYIHRRQAGNRLLLERLHQIYALPGFAGVPHPGVAKQNSAALTMPDMQVPHASSDGFSSGMASHRTFANTGNESDSGEDADDDQLIEEGGKLVDFMTNLAL